MQGQSLKGVLCNYCMYTMGRKCVQCVGVKPCCLCACCCPDRVLYL